MAVLSHKKAFSQVLKRYTIGTPKTAVELAPPIEKVVKALELLRAGDISTRGLAFGLPSPKPRGRWWYARAPLRAQSARCPLPTGAGHYD